MAFANRVPDVRHIISNATNSFQYSCCLQIEVYIHNDRVKYLVALIWDRNVNRSVEALEDA